VAEPQSKVELATTRVISSAR